MAQKLCLPFTSNILSASYKSKQYKDYYGYAHYGWDMGCKEMSNAVYALGDGIVIAAGMDGKTLYDKKSNLGNCIVVVYENVFYRVFNDQGEELRTVTGDIACRMFHFENLYVKAGQQVRTGTKLGDYGHTGATNDTDHLHIEFDSDTKYSQYAIGVAQSDHKIIFRGTVDSTLNPRGVFFIGNKQTIRGCPGNNKLTWYVEDDINLPYQATQSCPTCGREL